MIGTDGGLFMSCRHYDEIRNLYDMQITGGFCTVLRVFYCTEGFSTALENNMMCNGKLVASEVFRMRKNIQLEDILHINR